MLPNNPKPGRVSELLADLDHWAGRLTPGSYSSDALLFWLVGKLLESCGTSAVQRQSATLDPSATRIYVYYSWSWRWRKKATST